MSKSRKPGRPKKDPKQPKYKPTYVNTDIMTDKYDNKTDRIINIDEEVTRLRLHGLSNRDISKELDIHVDTVRAHVRKVEKEIESIGGDVLKSKGLSTILRFILDSDMIMRRYSIALTRALRTEPKGEIDEFIKVARALESQAKTLTDCLVRMGVVRTPEKGKGTQYPHSPNDNNSEELTPIQEKGELIKYHERRLKALKRKDTQQNKEVKGC